MKWQRRQTYKKKPFWVWDKYEISKTANGKYKVIEIINYSELGEYDSLKEAKESV